MGPLFADASFFVALLNERDQWNLKATALLPMARARAPLRVHAIGVAEVIAVVGSAGGGKAARIAYEAIRDTASIHVPTLEEMDAAMELVVRYDGTLSLSDALFLLLMHREDATEILSFDRGFDGKGVQRIHLARGQ